MALAGNVGISVPTEDDHRFVQTSASLSLAVGLSDQWGAYVEYFGIYPATDATHDARFLNTGVTYLVNKDFQIDYRVGVGLNEEADDFFTAFFGLRSSAFRVPLLLSSADNGAVGIPTLLKSSGTRADSAEAMHWALQSIRHP